MNAYLAAVGLLGDDHAVRPEASDVPLFQSLTRDGTPSGEPLTRQRALDMMKRRCRAVGFDARFRNHSCRATGITIAIKPGVPIERGQRWAAHADVRTMRFYLYDETQMKQAEIERISYEPGPEDEA